MPPTDILPKLSTILVELLCIDADQVTPAAHLKNDLGADPLDLADIILAIEDEFSIDIPDADAEKIKTVQDALTYLQSRLQ